MKFRIITSAFLLLASFGVAQSQHSVAKQWNEKLLKAIQGDFGRPTVHARNLFHTSVAMYDAWAAYDTIATPYLLGKTVGDFTCPFDGIPVPADIQAARDMAVSYAAYRVIKHRFQNSPGNNNPAYFTSLQLDFKMLELGYDINNTSTDYSNGDPAALGNYIASQVIGFGFQDGANEPFNYANLYYQPVNPPLVTNNLGNPDLLDFNRWQPLTLDIFIDQNGIPIPYNTPPALSPEWGEVVPFSMDADDMIVKQRDGHDWKIYHDPGAPPHLDINDSLSSAEYKWNFELVSAWSSHLTPDDNVVWDISPGSIGNIQNYPTNFDEYQTFYDFQNGGSPNPGYAMNPKTGQPYDPQYVTLGDYARVLAEFWADGPNSNTPPGHWNEILNYVTSRPDFVRKFRGVGEEMDPLKFDVMAYFMLNGALHDAAVTAWGIKGFYDGIRPISAIRGMAEKGQSSDPNLPNYNPLGLQLVPGLIEMVEMGDPLAGMSNEYVGEVKILAWRGPDYIGDPATTDAGVDWILAKNWWPYQRPTFVSPPFQGYISGHSTYSRTAAEVMTALTGDPYFPGGMGEFQCPKNEFLVFEDGPSQSLTLQWATYRDASDQCSLSRIWGGIHPPFDDIPGRLIGMEIAAKAVPFAESFFFKDEDGDGFLNYVDCNDHDASINPDATEICDGVDNECNGLVDDGLVFIYYYLDSDGDGFGDATSLLSSCAASTPTDYVTDNTDCDDTNAAINPATAEICDGIDNDCTGLADDGLVFYPYFLDNDNDGYGDTATYVIVCEATPPTGYAILNGDCDENNAAINPGAAEVCDNIDNDCDGLLNNGLLLFPYFLDSDGDGFGDVNNTTTIVTCETSPPSGYVTNNGDCDDTNAAVNPDATEIMDGIDNDCDGEVDEVSATTDVAKKNWKLFPNPTTGSLNIQFEFVGQLNVQIFRTDGGRQLSQTLDFTGGTANLSIADMPQGVYLLMATDAQGNRRIMERVVKM
ncbi:MAG: T9SS type A sorting domain-containing protein [Saprospiraceae bacterium]|nr:T9SS type A sorting domain-containing protein [Saprospiraceae bacterium]MCF8250370.1 T9SS type A sorting domain-containing protein [Saprospiraceae bacterium]MCF8280393.1 T9SS type A sorting domain-containing protein [Bacteroidales bacterium]MCF8312178.1 T9SS type A sorting domain-containing protein [Saprospiraceae bacterium]MCF8441858.1 T9SS type A sorting domain-containing protein [Saprospiraceae bacterium]